MKNNNPIPPKWPGKFLNWFCREDYLDEIEGDLIELFEKRNEVSPKKAKWRFTWDVIKSFRPRNIKDPKLNNYRMNTIQNYTKVYFRRLRRDTSHYMVNILGLSLGFSVLFFILLYVHDEWNIDAYHSNGDRIYRVIEKSIAENGEVKYFGATANPLAGALKSDYAEIEETASMIYMGSAALKYGENAFPDRQYAFATASLFNMLDFDIVSGDPHKQLSGPIGLVLNKDNARKLFGEEDPIGKIVELPSKGVSVEVLAVMDNMPKNSTYQFNMIFVSEFEEFGKMWPDRFGNYFEKWDSRGLVTFAMFKENTSPQTILETKSEFLKKYYPEEIRNFHDFNFQPLKDIHLNSSHLTEYSTEPLRTIQYSNSTLVSILLLIGIFVILIAGINYINLSSVMAIKRTVEAGIRKINGATSGQLRTQLFFETALTLVLAYVMGMLLILLLFPNFLKVANKEMPFNMIFEPTMIVYQVLALGIIWLIASVIPAIYYSRMSRSLAAVKTSFLNKGDILRKSFVTIQYGISLLLIIGSLIFFRQLNFIQEKEMGFDKEKMITIDINSSTARDNQKNIIATLKQHPDIENASTSSRVPGEWKSMATAGILADKNQEPVMATHYAADHHWIDTYGMKLIQGQNFTGSGSSDTLKVILNEKAVTSIGLDDPIGKSIWVSRYGEVKMQVVGVVKDFHFQSLHETISPVIITSPENGIMEIDYFTVKYKGNVAQVVDHIHSVQKEFDPKTPAEINFLDVKWQRYYEADQSRSNLILIATIISILISSFGLFGLINFSIEQKTKEIGVRKVLGARVYQVIQLILKDYVVLMVIALLIASPLAYWILSEWLAGFAYRINFSIDTFIVAFLLTAFVSLITVIYKVYKFAQSNPVDSLRRE